MVPPFLLPFLLLPFLLLLLLLLLQMKQSYHGFVPLDGSPTLIIEPQQDAALQAVLMTHPQTPAAAAGSGQGVDLCLGGTTTGTSSSSSGSSSSSSSSSSRRRPLGSLRLVTEDQAWQLYECGCDFADQLVKGLVPPLHLQLNQQQQQQQ
jgi:hypothetical protein